MSYYINTKRQSQQDGGNYEIHQSGCKWCVFSNDWYKKLPDKVFLQSEAKSYVLENIFLYRDYNTKEIIDKRLVNGCKDCCPFIHTA